MYIEALHSAIETLLKNNKANITITLPNIFYRRIQEALNKDILTRSVLPIDSMTVNEFVIYGRTVKIVEGADMTKEFQIALDQQVTKLISRISRVDAAQTTFQFMNETA